MNPDATTIPALSSLLTKNGAPPLAMDAGTSTDVGTVADTARRPTPEAPRRTLLPPETRVRRYVLPVALPWLRVESRG